MDEDPHSEEVGKEVYQDTFAWQVIEALGQGVTILDANGRFTYVNPAYARMVGRPPEELIGKSPHDFTHPQDLERLRQARQDRQLNQTTTYETRLLRSDGGVAHVYITGVPRRQEGQTIGSFAIVADITAKKQAEEAYRTLVENSLQGLVIVQDMRIVFANKQVETVNGYTPDELLAWSPERFSTGIYEADREIVAQRLQAHQVGEPAPAQMDFRIYHKDGSIRWVEIHVAHINYRGRPAVQVAYLDITESKEAQIALSQEKQFSEVIIDSLPGIFYVFNDQGQMTRWNKALETVSGYTAEEIAHMQPLAFIAEADRVYVAAKIQEVFTQGEAAVEAHFLFKDGRQRPYFFTGKRILFDGRPHLIGVGLDIGDRLEAVGALRASEEQYRRLVSSVGDIIFQVDTAGQWTFLNHAWTEITGFSVAESLGQNVFQYVYPDDRQRNKRELNALLAREKEFCDHQSRYITKSGGHRWLEVNARRVENDSGAVNGVFGLLRDITERKRREWELECMVTVTQALRQTNTRERILQVVLDQTLALLQAGGAMFISYANEDGKWIEAARGAWQMLHGQILPPEVSLANFVGDPGELFITHDARHSLPAQYAQLLHPHDAMMGAPVMSDSRVAGALWVGRPHPFLGVEGRSLQAIAGIAATALGRAQLLETLEQRVTKRTYALAAANERLQELDRLKTKFINDVSHELRTPVTNIGLYLDLLARNDPQKRERYLAALRQSSDRLHEIISSILQFTELAETAVTGASTAVDLNQVAASVIDLHRSRAGSAKLELTWTPAAKLPPVLGVAGLTAQAIAYLLDNAIKYTAAGASGNLVEISSHLDQERQMAGVQIKDTGIGIAEDELVYVFDRFYRGRQVSQLTVPGVGLGLSLAQQIAAEHQGRIEIQSRVNVGTAVTLWLPLVQGE